ncbi:hypothetical protein MPSEU_000031600 [Mayamaea pseudoterrestris]|nr:hypothetical protein MPSEU_000031600 [Mayamaea pseudoterrestris]
MIKSPNLPSAMDSNLEPKIRSENPLAPAFPAPSSTSSSLVHDFYKYNEDLQVRFTRATQSTNDQQETELECRPYFADLSKLPESQLEHLRQTGLLPARTAVSDDDESNEQGKKTIPLSWLCLVYDAHLQYVSAPLSAEQPALSWKMCSLDASRSWLIYWCLHAHDLLTLNQAEVQQERSKQGQAGDARIVQTLASMWREETIYITKEQVERDYIFKALATEYQQQYQQIKAAAANKTCTLGNEERTKDEENQDEYGVPIRIGGFGGGPNQLNHAATTYAAVLALCILWSEDAKSFLLQKRFQLYAWMALVLQQSDGSFRMHEDGEIDVRATYCLLSVATLLNVLNGPSIHHGRAVKFISSCQTFEGGFGGEPYSEAHGGYTFCAIAAAFLLRGDDRIDINALTEWLVRRQTSYEGGFNGRSNKLVDGCYSFWVGAANAIVSMLPLQQDDDPWLQNDARTTVLFDQGMLERYTLTCAQNTSGGLRDKPSKSRDHYHSCYNLSGLSVAQYSSGDAAPAFGHPQQSRVARTHPVYNIRTEKVREVLAFFQNHDADAPASAKQ